MELRLFAETILLSGNFEQKLAAPNEFSDNQPGTSIESPDLPMRENTLRFHQDSSGHSRITFPTLSSLKSEEARAKVFHAFANHELLAMELMALALLKFPEAPKPFRLGLAYCLTEEQEHLKLYLARMREFGFEFGSFPVNGFFWNVLKGMKSPLDFVTGMSLTFEQANLDFSWYYKNVFENLGDGASHKIMDKVYLEEIGHVKFGVQWFDKWRPSTESQWKFYSNNLTLPLTPQRAKGLGFNTKHREGTGLDLDFLENLEMYSHSKGRPPQVFIFNSNCELEWAGYLKKQSTFQAPKFQLEVSSDLASLMMFLGHQEDIVALPILPSIGMIRKWREWGFSTPNFIKYSPQNPELLVQELNTFKVNSLDPWGWSPMVAKDLGQFQSNLVHPQPGWPPFDSDRWSEIAPCFQKTSVPLLLEKCLQSHPEWAEIVCLGEDVGKVCDSIEAVVHEVECILELNGQLQPVVIKAPLGSSGFNMIRILALPIDNQQMGWIKNTLENQGQVVVEPWFERIVDFSLQIEVNRFTTEALDRVKYLGFTRILSDHRGQYGGHQLGRKLDDLPEAIRQFYYQSTPAHPSLQDVLKETVALVGQWLFENGFHGPAGIDTFIYFCKKTNRFRIKPIVEINARFTMGRVALRLEEHLSDGSNALWIHMSKQRLAKQGFLDWNSWLETLNQKISMELVRSTGNSALIRLKSGVFPTNDPETANSFLSVLVVHRNLQFLRSVLWMGKTEAV